jgi:glycosyltransferase involved in cell wall biosynthesis
MAEQKPQMTIVYFCFGDKWQDWEKRGFANRTASIARELALHPKVKKLIVVNNPTSYPAIWFKRPSEEARGNNVRLCNSTAKMISAGAGVQVKRERVRKTVRLGIHRYLVEEINERVDVIEQVRLLPKERSNRFKFAFNNALFDGALIRMLKSLLSSAENGQAGNEKVGNEKAGNSQNNNLKSPSTQSFCGQSANEKLVLWLNNPVLAKFIGALGEDLAVYDARDDWVHHPQLAPVRKAMESGYRLIRQKSDIVFAVSQSLVETFSDSKPEVFLSPNAIDRDLFDPAKIVPADTAKIPGFEAGSYRLIAGYVGKMQDRFDVQLTAKLARTMPDTAFILVGPVFTPAYFEPLKQFSNVFFTGRVHQSEVSSLIDLFNVCIMPHVKSDLTKAMDPLKIYEYLALGKPVICTESSDLRAFGNLIEIANDAKEFKEKLLASKHEDALKKESRIAFSKDQIWGKRVECMVKELDRKLIEKALAREKYL